MTTALAKTSKMLKGMTAPVRSHMDAVERARDIYLAQMKRAEAEYFDRIKHVTAVATGVDHEAASQTAPTQAAAAN